MPYKTKEENQRYQKVRNLRRRYKMTLDEYDSLIEKQKGVCAICGYRPTEKHRALSVDHCHSSGKVRGLLCAYCNRKIIGAIEKIGFEKIAEYLGYAVMAPDLSRFSVYSQ